MWRARDVLRKAEGDNGERSPLHLPPSAFEKLVILDGFTDFTRTQHEIIEILARRAETMFITLPLEQEPQRADLFAKPLKTLSLSATT